MDTGGCHCSRTHTFGTLAGTVPKFLDINFCLWTTELSGDQKRVRWSLLLKYLLITSYIAYIGNAEVTHGMVKESAEVSHAPTLSGWNLVDSSKLLLSGKLHAQPPESEPLSYIRRSSLSLLSLSKSSEHDQYSAPSSPVKPPSTVNNGPGSYNDSSESPGYAQPPFAFHSPGKEFLRTDYMPFILRMLL